MGKLGLVFTSLLLCLSAAKADIIASYDLATATSAPSVAATFVEPGYTASALTINNSANTASTFSNHFYHNGWDTFLNLSKYYEATIGGTSAVSFDAVTFSLENTGGTSTYWLRTSLDGFSSDIATGTFSSGLVTDFNVNLSSSVGSQAAPVTFRWYIGATSQAGFANHEPGGAGGGLADVGQDLAFHASAVPEPSTYALMALGLVGLGVYRKKRK